MTKFERVVSACVVAAVGSAIAIGTSERAVAQRLGSPTYTREQAAQGSVAYVQSCASCHGQNLDDGQFAPPLSGSTFRQQWGSKSVDELFTMIPEALRDPAIALMEPLAETGVVAHVKTLAGRNAAAGDGANFIGGGLYDYRTTDEGLYPALRGFRA